ncbi:hypothetical protein DKX38_009088 [Salix brachista]|uniref:Protein kinase domain-containing protein n=1 Tax=Salix brachista TaxID=2182728 RepID=A0A5N5M9W6_9ROSI|nr:hypothetical protein DKX38_009088 [Salix brachista]
MKLHPLLQRHFSHPKPPWVQSLHTSAIQETSVSDEVFTVVKTMNPMEQALEPMVPFLSPKIITSIIQNPPNPQLGFRFFIWASNFKRFRAWESCDLITDLLINQNGLELYCQTLETLKNGGIKVPNDAFLVLIKVYLKMGLTDKAMETFGSMRDFDCTPDVYTYNMILDVLIQKNFLLLALTVYTRMMKVNCLPNVATFSILIDGLCKSGNIKDALHLFDEMTQRGILPDAFTYCVVISGLCRSKRVDDAYRLFDKMKDSGVGPDFVTCNALLNGFCMLDRVDEAFSLLRLFEKDGYVLDVRGYSCLIRGLFRAKRYEDVQLLYRKMIKDSVKPDVYLYTIMMKGLAEAGKVRDALELLNEMTESGVVPDTVCYNVLIKGLCDMGLLSEARSLQLEISRRDCFPNAKTYSILISGMCRNGLTRDAQEIFNEMEKLGCYPSSVTFNSLIDGLCKTGQLEKANLLFYKMEIGRNPSLFLRLSQGPNHGLSPDNVTYGTLINGLLRFQREKDAFKVFDQMEKNGCTPDAAVYRTMMTWMCRRMELPRAFSLWLKYLRNIRSQEDEAIKAIEGYFEKQEVEKAVRGLLEMDFKLNDFDLGPYAIWLIGLCQTRRVDEALKIFLILEEYKVIITPPSCVKLIYFLLKEGNLDRAIDVFLYTIEKGYLLRRRVANRILTKLVRRKGEMGKDRALYLLCRMKSVGYDLNAHLLPWTKSLLHRHNIQEMENGVPEMNSGCVEMQNSYGIFHSGYQYLHLLIQMYPSLHRVLAIKLVRLLLTFLEHGNIILPRGWSTNGGEFVLVYGYMSKGSLNNHLQRNGRYLPWKTRFNKVFDLSPALLYLHEESKKCVLHCDIKSPNVMLDSKCKTMLGDLGAAMFLDQPDLALQTRKMVGKFGYVAPGFSYQGRAGKEADVYSFGVLVLEIASDERLDMDFSKHEMNFNKQEHPIAKQRPKISQAIELCVTVKSSCVMDSDDVDQIRYMTDPSRGIGGFCPKTAHIQKRGDT